MSARAAAIARIVRAARKFPDVPFRFDTAEGDEPAMDARDSALASAIEHNVLKRWLTLIGVLESQLSRPWSETETKLQAALLCGTAQLLLMDRLPEYAVIDETVEWAKANVRAKAGGLVNAVLRKVSGLRVGHVQMPDDGRWPQPRDLLPLHDGRVLQLNAAVFADDPTTRLAQQTSHPLELLEHWIGQLGVDRTHVLAAHDLVQPPIIVHGIDAGAAANLSLRAHDEPGFFVLDSNSSLPLQEFLRSHPEAIVQDTTSAAAVAATSRIVPAPSLIIDACAGRGTKTRQLVRTWPDAQIIASDIDRERLESLRAAMKGIARVRVVEHARLTEFAGKADLVLLDVPCSNTGVLPRRVEAKYRFTRASLRSLVDVQRQIIADAMRLLSEQGWVCYTTCSVDAAENRQQAAWLAQWHPIEIFAQEERAPAGLPGDSPTIYRDGGYWSLLRRKR